MAGQAQSFQRPFRPPLPRAPAAEPAAKRQKLIHSDGEDDSDGPLVKRAPPANSKAKRNSSNQVLSDDEDSMSDYDDGDDGDDPEAKLYDALFAEFEDESSPPRQATTASSSRAQTRAKPPAAAAAAAAARAPAKLSSSSSALAANRKPSAPRLGLLSPQKPWTPAVVDRPALPRKSGQLEDGPFFICQWRKPQTRKHKTWDGDALLIIHKDGGTCTLRCLESQRDLASRVKYCYSTRVSAGDQLAIAGYEVELDRAISLTVFLKGPPYDTTETKADAASHRSPLAPLPAKPFTAPKIVKARPQPIYPAVSKPTASNSYAAEQDNFSDHDDYALAELPQLSPPKAAPTALKGKSKEKQTKETNDQQAATLTEKLSKAAPAKSFYSTPSASQRSQSPAGIRPSGLMNPGMGKDPRPRFDPTAVGALVMPRPDEEHQKLFNRKGLPVIDVVVDPIISNQLRPHQREGVRFLYECMMGMRGDTQATGAILADEMGLGKTLQTIALIQTLLRQNCYYTPNSHTIERAIIVCPLTLVKNWRREFRKWTGNSISVMCIDGESKDNVAKFAYSKTHQVLVIGYERLRTCIDTLAQAQPPIGLIVCDEGHRLKSKQTQTTKMFDGLDAQRRIILSGTPIQNDLLEFFAMFDFVVPGHLGQPNVFKAVFADPIMKSRVKGASKDAVELGKARTEALTQVTHQYILRRTADILGLYLPPKLEVVVHVAPSQLQLGLYRKVLQSQMVADVIQGDSAQHLALIGILRRLCNTPEMLLKDLVDRSGENTVTREILGDSLELFPTPSLTYDYALSGKLTALMKILKQVYDKTSDKVVLVSNFTTTLDILEGVLRKERYSFCRLDGKTKQKDRMDIVNDFNRQSASKCFVFLLSAKSGGVGLNLIGANRLILLDSDWNPSSDRQAMARIHRDGQKKPCFIYRMLTSGTMDEKIFLRQLSKIGLSDSLMQDGGATAGKKDSDSFSVEDLRDIFRLHTDTPCLSHALLECSCSGNGELPKSGRVAVANGGQAQAGKDGEDEDDDEEDEEAQGFMPATQHVLNEASKMDKPQRRREHLASLNDWSHFDCTDSANLSELLTDGILKALVQQQKQATPSPPSSPTLLTGVGALSSAGPGTKRKSELIAALERISQRDYAGSAGPNQLDGASSFDIEKVEPGSILFVYAKSMAKVTKLIAEDAVAAAEGGDDESRGATRGPSTFA
ncbi:helicase [Tilletia horrida]|nr:helicase [Tilletia horrida]